MTDNILEKTKSFVENKLKPIRPDAFRHTLRVVEYAKSIAPELGIGVREAELAALLHDIGRVQETKEVSHEQVSVQMTQQWLEEQNYPAKSRENVLEAISKHSMDLKKIDPLPQLLCDADRLDKLGIIGLLRVVYVMGVKRDFDPFEGKKIAGWFKNRSQKITKHLFTSTARKIAKKKNQETKILLSLLKG